MPGLTPEWIAGLIDTILSGYDAAVPCYQRSAYAAALTDNLLYPFMRAFLHTDLRQPLSREFAVSGEYAGGLAATDVWDTDVSRFGINAWVALQTLADERRLAQLMEEGKIAAARIDKIVNSTGFEPGEAAVRVSLEFLTGYVIEKSLAVDNIFVFVAVFSYFAVPPRYQHRVLFYGILGALVFRALFISLGAVLMQYKWVVLVFGVFLLATGIKILFLPEKPIDPERNPVIRLLKRLVPVWPRIEGEKFWVRRDGVLYATPLFVALVFIEFSDIIFAIDSVPAIFALTNEPLIVFTSNIFAILGLRAMFFLLANAVQMFHYLKYGLGVVLIFVGLKMVWLNQAFGGKFPITWSLGIIGAILALSMLVSVAARRRTADEPSGA